MEQTFKTILLLLALKSVLYAVSIVARVYKEEREYRIPLSPKTLLGKYRDIHVIIMSSLWILCDILSKLYARIEYSHVLDLQSHVTFPTVLYM